MILVGVAFRRRHKPKRLEPRKRQAILEAVRRNPGIRRGQLARALGLETKGVEQHAGVLARRGLIRRVSQGGIRFYPLGGCDECQQGPCGMALMPGELCPHGCGCYGSGIDVPDAHAGRGLVA